MRSEPVVLVHGFGSSFDHGWRQPGWADLLADGGRAVVPVDVLGHGGAPRPHDPEAYAGLERCVEAVLPADTPVDAVGFSLGAQLLLRLAARDSSRLARLVVIGVGENLLRGDDPEPIARALESGAAPADVGGRLFVQFAAGAGNDPLALAACLRRPSERFTPGELARVTCPVLVIMGDRDFAGPPDPLVAALPDARLVTLPGVDHFQATRDFRCIDAALDFLDVRL